MGSSIESIGVRYIYIYIYIISVILRLYDGYSLCYYTLTHNYITLIHIRYILT